MATFTLTTISGGSSLTPALYNQNTLQTQAAIRALQDASTTNGTVRSVGLVAPNIFSVSNSPITSTGNITFTLVSQTANKIFASPNGSSGVPSFRSIVLADLPTITPAKGGNGLTSLGTAYQILRVNSGASANEYISLASADAKLTLTPSSGLLTFSVIESELDMSNMKGTVAIINGGTGATTAQNAIKNLTQASSGTVGYYLTLDSGKNPVWTAFPSIDTTKLSNNSVTYSKFQVVTAKRLLGNPSGTNANASEISLSSNLLFSGSTLNDRLSSFSSVSANTTMTSSSGVLYVDATSAGITILTPDTSTLVGGEIFVVQKIDSAAHNVTVRCYDTGTDLINGGTEATIANQWNAISFQYCGTIGGKNTFRIISKIP